MLGYKYIKFDSMTYVVRYRNGKVVKEGRGLSFFYFAPSTSIAAVPMGSNDLPFIFNESTADYQQVSIQGQISYKVTNPKQLAELLDFTVDGRGEYKKQDIEKLNQRIITSGQTAATAFIHSLGLKDATRSAKQIEEHITAGLKASDAIAMLGIEVLAVNVMAIRATPEMERALETETRERLQQDADQAIYDRRNFAVEQERRIKESELSTEIAVEEKKKKIAEKQWEAAIESAENDRKLREMKLETDLVIEQRTLQSKLESDKQKAEADRQLRELRLAADVVIETARKAFIAEKDVNDRKAAETRGFVLDATLKPYKDMDWRLLSSLAGGHDSRQQIALAFRQLAENADKIGTLNVTPDLLEGLLEKPAK